MATVFQPNVFQRGVFQIIDPLKLQVVSTNMRW